MIKKLINLVAFLLFCVCVQAQHDVHYTMFMFNKIAINPAYAGSKEVFTMSGHYRNQWPGIKGAPQTFTFSAHTPLFKKRTGVGISIIADKIGMVNTYYTDLSYAYRIKLDKETTLSVGLMAQLQYGRINWQESDPLDAGDNFVPSVGSNKLNPNFGMGAYYQAKNYYLGFSVPRIFKTTIYDDNPIEYVGLNSIRSSYIMGGFVARLSRNVKLQPGVLLTYNPSAPFEMDLNASLVFMDRFWVGLSYRLEDSMDAIVQFQISQQLKAAVALDFTFSELNNYSPGSFELMLQYCMVTSGAKLNNIRYFF